MLFYLFAFSLKQVQRTNLDFRFVDDEPARAILPRRKANARAESAAPTELLFFCPCLPRVLFVPLALSPPWALQEYRPKGLTHPHVMYKPKWICARLVVGSVIVGLDCGRRAFVGSDMLVHGNGLGFGIRN